MTNWSSKDSLKVYNVPYWGAGFFNINDAGHVTVSPDKSRPEAQIVLSEAIEQLRQSGLLHRTGWSRRVRLRAGRRDAIRDTYRFGTDRRIVFRAYPIICRVAAYP